MKNSFFSTSFAWRQQEKILCTGQRAEKGGIGRIAVKQSQRREPGREKRREGKRRDRREEKGGGEKRKGGGEKRNGGGGEGRKGDKTGGTER